MCDTARPLPPSRVAAVATAARGVAVPRALLPPAAADAVPPPVPVVVIGGRPLSAAHAVASTPALVAVTAAPTFHGIPPAVASMSLAERLQVLAVEGGPIARHESFRPNSGRGVPRYPAEIAPQAVIVQHFVAAVRAGKGIVLRLADAATIAAAQGCLFHVSPAFLTYKEGASLMRLIDDFSVDGPNHPAKKAYLAETWGSIQNPGCADLCAALANAREHSNGAPVFGVRADAADAYKRVRTRPIDVPVMGLSFFDDAEELVYLPLTNEFGSQDSNYQWGVAATALIARSLRRDWDRYGCYVSSVYTDDFWHFGPREECDEFVAQLTADAVALIGADPIKPAKTIIARQLPLHGYALDCDKGTIGITERIFARFWHKLESAVAATPAPGDRIALTDLQALGSYAIRCAPLMPTMRAWRKGFSFNLRRAHVKGSVAFLTPRSVRAVAAWRQALRTALYLPELLVVPISVPLIFRRLPGESRAALAARQAAAADCVGFADACTDGHGLGGYIPGHGYFSTAIPALTSYARVDGSIVATDINPLEFLALLLLADAMATLPLVAARGLPQPRATPPLSHRHLHIWSDNASTVAWATNASAAHPLHQFLMQALAELQVHWNCTFSFGSIAGKDNIHADAASRDFNCPDGPRLRCELARLPRLPVSTALLTAALVASQPTSPLTSRPPPSPHTGRVSESSRPSCASNASSTNLTPFPLARSRVSSSRSLTLCGTVGLPRSRPQRALSTLPTLRSI